MLHLNKFLNYQKSFRRICIKHWKLYTINRSFSEIHGSILKSVLPIKGLPVTYRRFITCSPSFSEESEVVEVNETGEKSKIDPKKDRTKVIPPETSIRYMKSEAYKTTYGDEPVWVKYRRNFKGQIPPFKTRKMCIRGGIMSTGNPCPICRDEYLVLDYTNVELLKQFISPYTGEILSYQKTNLCQKRQFDLEVAMKKAKFYGYITYQVPFRHYDYNDYYPNWKQ